MVALSKYPVKHRWNRCGLTGVLLVVCVFGMVATARGEQVTMAIDNYPPYHIIPEDGGEPYGETISIVKAVVGRVNRHGGFDFTLSYTPDTPFKRCLQMMKKGEADIMGGLFNKADREAYMEMLEYKGRSNKIFVLPKTSRITITSHEDLQGLKIGTQLGFLYFDTFDTDPTLHKAPVVRIKQNMHKLLKGRIDTFVLSEIQFNSLNEAYPALTAQLKVAEYVYDQANPVCIGISRQSFLMAPVYLDIFRKVVTDMRTSGEFVRILEAFYEAYHSKKP